MPEEKKTEYKYGVYETTKNPYYKPAVTSVNNSDGKGSTFTITNNFLGQSEISVKKVWNGDDNNSLGLRSGSVDFTIKQNGTAYITGKLSSEKGSSSSIRLHELNRISI